MSTVVDRTIALAVVVLISPLLIVVALAVRTTSPGPVLFRQVRVGRGGREFTIYKFRTMVDGAERMADNVSPAGDPRITSVGRLLRKWYLDELPQLFNVLRGEMALVGPRPETPEHVALYTSAERAVLTVRPGLAGLSTLGFMDEAEVLAGVADPGEYYRRVVLHQRVGLDLKYLGHKSLTYDLRLLLRQALAILRH